MSSKIQHRRFRKNNMEITVSLPTDHELKLQVVDNGIGIKPEDLSRLFVEFQQVDSTTSRRYQGTGLGLALTKKIAELQGGTVGVQSELGRGSTFTVTLPLAGVPGTVEVGSAVFGS